MGKVIAKQIRGMSWSAKMSLVLVCTLLMSVFMYQGWYKPKGAEAAIAQLAAWSSVYNNTGYPTTAGSYTVPLGDKRMLVVGITSTTSTAVAQTMNSVTFNGVAMTPSPNNDNGANVTHSYLFYLPMGTNMSAGTTGNIVVSMSGGTSSRTYVYAATYSGVDQSAPIRDSKAFNIGGTSSSTVGPFNPALNSGSGDMAVEMINLTRTGSSSASSARTIQTWSSGWSSALSTTTGVTSGTYYAINAYAATRTTGTSTTSQHTASGSVLNSMAAMSIKAFSGPVVTLAAPDNGSPGETMDVVITGTSFVSGATVSFGPGITVNSTTFNSATQLTSNITIDSGAALGGRTVTVTNPDLTSGNASVFTVLSATAPTIDTVVNPNLGQGASNVNVGIIGSNFVPGTSVAVSGTGVTAVTNYVSPTALSVVMTVGGTATTGARDLIVTNPDTSTSTKAGALTINTRPTVTSASPLGMALGTTGNVTITGTGFVNGATASFSGTGVTVNYTTYVSATSLTANVTVDPAAAGGARTITVTNPDFGNNAGGSFTVYTAPAPTITSLTPSAVGRGATSVPFSITGTGFDPAATVTISGSATLGTMTVQGATSITGTIATVTNSGSATITVINPDGQKATATLTLNTYPSTPAISPTKGSVGQTMNVTITSGNLVTGATLGFSGGDITVNSATVASATTLNANITISPTAVAGTRSVTVTNPDFGTRTATNIFTVSPVAVQSAAPAGLPQGATRDITITGAGFAAGATVSASGSGLTVNSVSVTDANTLVANISADSSAATGARDLTVTVGANSGVGYALLNVTGGPAVTSLAPATLRQGDTDKAVTITGSNFVDGLTLLFNGTGVTLNSATVDSPTQITARVSIDQNAPMAASSVTVTNPDGGKSTGGVLTVLLTAKTVPGEVSFTKVTKDAISLVVPYSGDGNNDNSAQVAYGTTPALELGTVQAVKGSGIFSASFSNLQGSGEGVGKQYYFKVIFSDADGYVGNNEVDATQPTKGSPLLHNSQNTFSAKWSQGWGIDGGKYGAFQCSTCHNENTTNSKLVATTISSPSGENWDSVGNSASLNVVLRTTLGDDSAHATSTNVCEVCHSRTSHHKYDNAGANHQGAADCTLCHSHNEGFIPSCKTCHSSAQGNGGYRRQIVGSGGDFFANMSTHGKFSDPSSQTCTTCHDATAHQSFSDGVSVALKNADTGARVVYDGTSASAPATAGVCLSCHDSDGATRLGIIASVPFAASEDFRNPVNVSQYWPAGGGAHATKMYCFNCHGNSKGADGSTSNPKYNGHASGNKHVLQDKAYDVTNPNAYCFNCHNAASTDPNKSSKNISAEFALAYKHTTAKCFDCHGDENNSLDSMHSLKAGSQTARSGIIAANLSNATGKRMTWSASSWGGATDSTTLGSNQVSAEYQVCFKCHAATGTGTTPAVNNASYVNAGSLTNLALEFNPNNGSRHPVGTPLDSAAQLTTQRLAGGWTPGSVMTCSDCHATDSAASKGPHGSSVKWMLIGTNKAWPYTTSAGNGGSSGTYFMISNYTTGSGTNNGLFCLNCHTIRPSSGANSWHSNGDVTGGEHGGNSITACASCHIRVPHGGKIARLLLTTNAPNRYKSNGNGAFASSGNSIDSWGPNANPGSIRGTSVSSSNFNSSCTRHTSGNGETW